MYIKDGKAINLFTGMIVNVPGRDAGGNPTTEQIQLVLPISADRLAELGITEVPDPVRPDDRFNWVTENPDGTFTATPKDPAPFTDEFCKQIDAAADAAYALMAGAGGRVAEYQLAYDEASAFRDAQYAGTPGETVSGWATIKGWTNQQAADDILSARQSFYDALYAIRNARLGGKAAVQNAVTAEDKAVACQAALSQLSLITPP